MLRAPALWARAVAGQRRGPWASGLQALLAGKPTLAVRTGSVGSAGWGALAATPPGRAALRSPRRAGGGAQGEETQGPRAHKTTSPGCFGRGRSSALRGATAPGGGAQSIPHGGLVRGQRSPGRHGASARADGRWPGGDYLEATRAGKGPGQTGHARGGQGTPQQRGSPATRHPEPLEWERPSIPPVWICGG